MKKISPFALIVIVAIAISALSGSRFAWFLLIIYIIYLVSSNIKIFQNFNFLNNKSMQETIDIKDSFVKGTKGAKKFVAGIVALIIILIILASAIVIVEAGQTGVYSLFGKVRDQELFSGFHLVNPLAKVTQMSIRTEEYTMSILTGEGKKTGADSIAALTKEGLNVDLDITVLYRLDEGSAAEVYRTVGLNYEEKIIRPAIRSSIREVIAQYEAKDIYSEKRGEATVKIEESLSLQMESRGIILEEVLLRNVNLPANLARSIQEKLQAEQEAQKYDFILDREKKEAERKIIEAEGQRDSQTIINQSLTTNYLYYSYINQLKDREGTIYVPISPSSGLPLFRGLGN